MKEISFESVAVRPFVENAIPDCSPSSAVLRILCRRS